MAKQITISAPRPAPSFTPLFVAIDKFLPEEGIEAKIEYSVRNAAERALRGEIDYVATAVGRGRYLEPNGLIFVGSAPGPGHEPHPHDLPGGWHGRPRFDRRDGRRRRRAQRAGPRAKEHPGSARREVRGDRHQPFRRQGRPPATSSVLCRKGSAMVRRSALPGGCFFQSRGTSTSGARPTTVPGSAATGCIRHARGSRTTRTRKAPSCEPTSRPCVTAAKMWTGRSTCCGMQRTGVSTAPRVRGKRTSGSRPTGARRSVEKCSSGFSTTQRRSSRNPRGQSTRCWRSDSTRTPYGLCRRP